MNLELTVKEEGAEVVDFWKSLQENSEKGRAIDRKYYQMGGDR